MHKKANKQKAYYLSDRLKGQLAQMAYYPLTLVEAPSGFGKTTAVREYLKENLPPDARAKWYTCLGEPVQAAWRGICGLFSMVSDEIATNLIRLETPAKETLEYITDICKDLRCETETFLIIDNYHLVDCNIPHELMCGLAMQESPNLHILCVTQQLGPKQHFIVHNANIHTIDSSAFLFDAEGIGHLFRMEGIRLTEEERESIVKSTEGWISAIRFQMIHYKETGSFDSAADNDRLVELAVWDRLSDEEKEFLLSVSVLDCFDARQAAIMMGMEVLPPHIEDYLKFNDFIRYSPDKRVYAIHGVLREYLRNRFDHYQSKDFQNRIFHLAGQACAAACQYCDASRFFWKVRDFDAILSLPFTHEYLDEQKESFPPEESAAILKECPEEVMRKYPASLLLFGCRMLMDGQWEAYQKICRVLESMIQRGTEFTDETLREIEGEYLFLRSFEWGKDPGKMHEGQKKAWELLGKPSDLISRDFPFAFGAVSLLGVYWREPGGLENTLREMDEGLPCYLRLTRGHGAGADSVLRAEAMLMRGEDNEAEILCHKALYDARSHQQTGICINADLILARVAILRGDPEGYANAVEDIKRCTKETRSLYLLRMADICIAALSLVLGSTEGVARWIWDMDHIRRALYAPAVPLAQMLYSGVLIIEKRFSEFFGISQSMMDLAESMHYLVPSVIHHILLAVAKHRNGKDREARGHLRDALILAVPDRIFLPFAQDWDEMGPLLEAVLADSAAIGTSWGSPPPCAEGGSNPTMPQTEAMSTIPFREGETATALLALCKRQAKGASAVRKALIKTKSPLTPREREIALLVKDRLSAQEIADKLHISKATVKTVIRNVYHKLGIHSRTELNSVAF